VGRTAAIVACLSLFSGCSVESGVVVPDGGTARDSAIMMDGDPGDTSTDTRATDAGGPDSRPGDTGASDTAPGDAGADTEPPADTSPPPDTPSRSCAEIYDEAEEFALCFESDTECGFSAETPMGCTEVCAAYGGLCIRAIDNSNEEDEECTVLYEVEPCSMIRSTQLCVCTHPP